MKEPIVNVFARLTHWNQFPYRGVLVKGLGIGYKVGDVFCQDKDAVDAEINKRIESLQLSINRIKSNHVNDYQEKVSPEAHSAKS